MLSIIVPSHNETRVKDVYDMCKTIFPEAQVIISNDVWGKGKGYAVRKGIQQATGDVIALIDGDMDISPMYLKNMYKCLSYADVIYGEKSLREVPFRRKIISLCSRAVIGLLFGLGDTQTGIKIYKKRYIADFKTDGYAFDVEMMYQAQKMGARIKAYPIIVETIGKKNWRVVLKTLWDVIKIRLSV